MEKKAARHKLALIGSAVLLGNLANAQTVSPPTKFPEVEFMHVLNVGQAGSIYSQNDAGMIRRIGSPPFTSAGNPPPDPAKNLLGQAFYVPAAMNILSGANFFTRTSSSYTTITHLRDGTNGSTPPFYRNLDSYFSSEGTSFTTPAGKDYIYPANSVIPGLAEYSRYAETTNSTWHHANWSPLGPTVSGNWSVETLQGYAIPRYTGIATNFITSTATTSQGTISISSNKVAGGALWRLIWTPSSGSGMPTIDPINVFDYGRQIQTSVFLQRWQDPNATGTQPPRKFYSPLEGGDSHTWSVGVPSGDTESAADAAYLNGAPCLLAAPVTDDAQGRAGHTTKALPIEWWPDASKNADSMLRGVWSSTSAASIPAYDWLLDPTSTSTTDPGIIFYPKWEIGKTVTILTSDGTGNQPSSGVPVIEYATHVKTDVDIGSEWISRHRAIIEVPIAYLDSQYSERFDYNPAGGGFIHKTMKSDRIRSVPHYAVIAAVPGNMNNMVGIYTSSAVIGTTVNPTGTSSIDASLVGPAGGTGRKGKDCTVISVWREFPYLENASDTWDANTVKTFKSYLVFGTVEQVRANIDWLYARGY